MGNTASGGRERQKSGDASMSPRDGHAFEFGTKHGMHEGEPYVLRQKHVLMPDGHFQRPRASTLSEHHEHVPQEKRLPTMFKWDGGGKEVYISGTFTNWKPIPMVKSHGDFVTIVDLPEGKHQYKFLVDGEWRHDSHEPTADNGLGTENNTINVKKTDFEVFEALAIDGVAASHDNGNANSSGSYGQEIPMHQPWEKPTSPPILPPHLLQVILNKDTPLSCEPTLLPEPNHVMLNHLYALSIRDGVMVLSATHRYRKKYVTTLLYKPI
jgi:5'-AMP-activated protein kinase regulatory beta subunit